MDRNDKRESESPLEQPASLRVLSEYLNLSPATISLVLNNAPEACVIPQETRDRIIEAATKFDCLPSFNAQSLCSGQSYSVGVLVPYMNDHYATQVLAGVEEFLIKEGYFCLTASHHHKKELIEKYPQMLMERSVEGFILIDTMLEHPLGVPTVAVAGHQRVDGITNVVLDQQRAAELILRHLYQQGHRKIAFMRGGNHSSDANERWECLLAAARDLEMEIPKELIVQVKSRVSAPEIGYGPTVELIGRAVKFTALVCYNDLAAIGAIRALMTRGLHVPEDVSVVGFDDIQSATFHNPSLTTIRQPLMQMGNVAAKILLQRIRGEASFPENVLIQPEIVTRESSQPMRSQVTGTNRLASSW